MTRERIAVVGGGVAGTTAAYLLQRRHDVLLFHARTRLGADSAVDPGFLVRDAHRNRAPLRLFGELDVRTQDAEMSLGVRCLGCGLEYAGGRGARGLLATPATAARPIFLRLLAELARFQRHARRALTEPNDDGTLETFLNTGCYSVLFRTHFLFPLVTTLWSVPERVSRDFPARYLFEFMAEYRLLSVGGALRWRAVAGRSRDFLERATARLTAVHVATPVRAVTRHADHVEVRDDADRAHRVDRVVLATRADRALALLTDPTPAERAVLDAFHYAREDLWLHTDTSLLPRADRARASWNYLRASCSGGGDALVTCDLTHLRRLRPADRYLVTGAAGGRVARNQVLAGTVREHLVHTPDSLAAQRRLPELTGPRTAFAGAYHGRGFHEDGCAAGIRAAEDFGTVAG